MQPAHQNSSLDRTHGMTLTEVMVAMTIFVVLAGGIIAGVFTVRADSENNLYESASLNVAISFLEQLKSTGASTLADPPTNTSGKAYHTFMIGFGESIDIVRGQDTEITVPIISSADGEAKKELPVTVNITIEDATDFDGYWFQVDYSWEHPTSHKVYTGDVRGFSCAKVATY
ncbi:PulJ/GspJ family protein [Cerasicoccus maritimus]|uniref:PulJ/GspJ family protein n=1 Tax=Cerasicoccus maritimus TaxID=490089 RepID=UPI002852BA35|nr:prepilin-type N-terminal cleavage/methylation domain-containing protein [Cerasicoccus maritimus]